MIFAKGTRVLLKNTGDKGSIDQLLENEMVVVRLDKDGMLIPAFPEDLERLEETIPGRQPVKAKLVPGKQPAISKKPEMPMPEVQYTILKSIGIQLGFEPLKNKEGLPKGFAIHLINDTRLDVVYNIKITFSNEEEILVERNATLAAMSTQLIGELPFDRLNDAPKVWIVCWESATSGVGVKLEKTIRIKPKQFFKKLRSAPLLLMPVHHYILFNNLSPDEKPKTSEDLKSYTRRNVRTTERAKNLYQFSPDADPGERARFVTELDLHIDKITTVKRKLTNAEKLRIQLNAFDQYMDKAIRLGVPKVFIIHGVGKGRLKNEIASRLLQNPDVVSFKNEYHPAYGVGATEVFL